MSEVTVILSSISLLKQTAQVFGLCWPVAMTEARFTQQTAANPANALLPNLLLLRSAPLHVVMRHRGRVLENSEGTAESYDLSSQTDHLDTFVSHTWRTPKRQKFIALSLYFGFPLACACSLFVGYVISTLGALQLQFVVNMASLPGASRFQKVPLEDLSFGLLVMCSSCKATLFQLIINQNTGSVWTRSGSTRPMTQTRGSRILACSSSSLDRLLTSQTDDFLERPWTVHEVATFLQLNPKGAAR